MSVAIESVRVVAIVDDCADMSGLGEYTDSPSPWAVVRAEGEYLADLGDDYQLPERSREYRFFVPFAGGETPGSADFRKYGMQDYERAEDYNRQGWCYVGIRAEAVIRVNGVWQKITSAGLWGVESDSDSSYLSEIAGDEIADLGRQLAEIGISGRSYGRALADCDREPVAA